tara:strand:- start:103 stop:915 length:813 start_codon:yes stop_codon:yes gene_type:complete
MKSRDLDQFYTSTETSSHLMLKIRKVLLEKDLSSHTFIEPSAGTGSFSDHFSSLSVDFVAIDIDPQKHYILKADFLSWQPNPAKRYVAIGNPPFGKNSSLAIKFFNKSATFCDLIAFVLPKTFKKNSVKNKINLNFRLIYEEDLPEDSFVFNGNSYSVPCCFQIWERTTSPRQIYTPPKTDDFSFVQPCDADIAFQRVGVNAGKITLSPYSRNKNINSHIFIKFRTKTIQNKFLNTNFEKYKLMTAGNPSISKSEILEIWSNLNEKPSPR